MWLPPAGIFSSLLSAPGATEIRPDWRPWPGPVFRQGDMDTTEIKMRKT